MWPSAQSAFRPAGSLVNVAAAWLVVLCAGAGVWLCDGPKGSWAQAWPDLQHYDA